MASNCVTISALVLGSGEPSVLRKSWFRKCEFGTRTGGIWLPVAAMTERSMRRAILARGRCSFHPSHRDPLVPEASSGYRGAIHPHTNAEGGAHVLSSRELP